MAGLVTLATASTDALLAAGEPATSALTGGYQLAFLIAAGLVATAFALALLVLRSERSRAEEGEASGRRRKYVPSPGVAGAG